MHAEVPGTVMSLTLHDLTVLLVKAKELREGHYELAVKFEVTVGAFGMKEGAEVSPGVLAAIGGVNLVARDTPNPMTVDAAVVNPLPVTEAPASGAKRSRTKKAMVT